MFRNHDEEITAAWEAHRAERYARKLAAQFFNERVSTIYDPRYGDNPWVAFFGEYAEGDHMARGKNEAQAIRHLIEEARRVR